jgi:hypothetical protein
VQSLRRPGAARGRGGGPGKLRLVVYVRPDEAVLLLGGGIRGCVAGVGSNGVVVVVCPLREVVCELEPREVSARVLEVDDDELLMFVRGLEERGLFVVGPDAEDVAVLGL